MIGLIDVAENVFRTVEADEAYEHPHAASVSEISMSCWTRMIFRNSSLSQIKGGGQLTRIKGGEGEVKLPILVRAPPS